MTNAKPTIKLMAASEGIISTKVRPKMRSVLPSGNPPNNAAMNPPRNTAVPGKFKIFKFTVASSGVGFGATGGIFSTVGGVLGHDLVDAVGANTLGGDRVGLDLE